MRVYKMTDENMQTYGGLQWVLGEEQQVQWGYFLCEPGCLHWYKTPTMAVVANPLHRNFQNPRMFVAESGGEWDYHTLKGGSSRLTLLEEVEVPVVTFEQTQLAVMLAATEIHERVYTTEKLWLERWLSGDDRTEETVVRNQYNLEQGGLGGINYFTWRYVYAVARASRLWINGLGAAALSRLEGSHRIDVHAALERAVAM